MWKKITAILLLLVFPFCLFAQSVSDALSSVERIKELTQELRTNLLKQEELITKLETSNEELSKELQEALKLLKESEESLRKQIALSENLGWLIEDQSTYLMKLKKETDIWKIISGVLALSLATTIVITVTK